VDDGVRRGGYLVEANDNDDEVQEQIGPNQEHRDPDGLPKALEEHRTQQRDQEQGYGDLLAMEEVGGQGVCSQMGGGVRVREGYSDYVVGGYEPEKGEHEELALPERKQPL
jgi:hypothetical protein